MELGWPLPKRKHYLSELIKGESSKTHPVPFDRKMQYMKVYSIPLDLPRYRLENGRTAGAQAEFLAKNTDFDDEFFRLDGESEEAQKAQHTILTKLAKERKNLFKEFETAEQEEPIILSYNGYVINGNRRLSTWRSLYDDDPKKYQRFHSIDAVVLPFCDEREHDRVEAELQLKEDLKADYIWTSHAIMLREKMDRYKYDEDTILAIYDLKKKDLTELLDALDYADEYLSSRGLERNYSAVDDKEYAFRQIVRNRSKAKSPAKREVFEKAAFCLTDSAAAGTRTYAEIQKVADHLSDVADELIEEFEINVNQMTEDQVAESVTSVLEEEDNFDRARETITEAIASASARTREKKKELRASSNITQAKKNLQDAKQAIDDRSSKKGVVDDLDQISSLLDQLRQWAEGDE